MSSTKLHRNWSLAERTLIRRKNIKKLEGENKNKRRVERVKRKKTAVRCRKMAGD